MSAVDATDVACGVGNIYGGHVYTGSDRDTIELGIRRLLAAGYRLLAPGEVDRETMERCAKIAAAFADSEGNNALAGLAESSGVGSPGWRKDAMHSQAEWIAEQIATAIRTLTDGGHDA
ncbi:MAG TPA: hypothetical protein VFJ18_12140 [Pararhizobium sp.]|nr:hypothetical protein [Pararhizobium sp.]